MMLADMRGVGEHRTNAERAAGKSVERIGAHPC
jgi:hypothetical protein